MENIDSDPKSESMQLLKANLGDWLPPETEGAELRAAEGGAVLCAS